MRNLKFRAWSKNGEKIDNPDKEFEFNFAPVGGPFWLENKGHESIFLCGKTIEQFTGLKDSKGVEIYEGDILKFKSHAQGKDFDGIPGKVSFEETLSGFWFNCSKDNGEGGLLVMFIELFRIIELTQGIEVIGNIHENPELLDK